MSQRHTRRHLDVAARRRRLVATFDGAPFTTAEATAVGLSQSDLRSDAVVRLRRGVYVAAEMRQDFATRCAGALVGAPEGARIGSFSAATLLGLPAPPRDRVYVAYPYAPRRTPLGVVPVRAAVGSRTQVRSLGPVRLPFTGSRDVLGERASEIGLVDGVVLADAVLNREPEAEVRRAWASGFDARAAWVRRLSELARVGAESPMETRLRVLLVLSGLPEPVVQHEVMLAGRRRRFDLAYPRYRVAVEYDGGHHYMSEAQKHADIMRNQAAEWAGWHLVHVVSHGIYQTPDLTVQAVADALRRRGADVVVGDGALPYFPGRG